MSRLDKITNNNDAETIVEDISGIVQASGAEFNSHAIASDMMGIESLDEVAATRTISVFDGLVSQLNDSLLGDKIRSMTGNESQQTNALKAAALTILSGGNRNLLKDNISKEPAINGEGTILVDSMQCGGNLEASYGIEAFDPTAPNSYVYRDAYANALGAIFDEFESVFFPNVILPAGETGISYTINQYKVFTNKSRDSLSSPGNFDKRSLIAAHRDHTVLEAESTALYPHALDATTPAELVPASKVPTFMKRIQGVDIDVRPILFGKEVDLIQLSSAPALLNNQVFDTTDSLDSTINIGTVWIEVTFNGNTYTFLADISSQQGSLLTRTPTGSSRDYNTTMEASIIITQDTLAVLGNPVTAISDIETVLGIAAGTDFSLVFTASLSATANVEYATSKVYANDLSLVAVYDANGDEAALPGTLPATAALGYLPVTRRTNSNFRSDGTILDVSNSITYLFPCPPSSPLITENPIGTPITTAMEALESANKIRTINGTVNALMNLETTLRAYNVNKLLPLNNPYIGGVVTVPTLVEGDVDLSTVVQTSDSRMNLENLQGALMAAMTVKATEMIQNSNYLSGLKYLTGKVNNFEVITVTDEQIGPLIDMSGKDNVIGGHFKFTNTICLDERFKGKIYMSLRTTDNQGMYPLNLGFTLTKPSMTFDVNITAQGGSNIRQQRHIPVVASYASLPVLSVINVLNLNTLYTS